MGTCTYMHLASKEMPEADKVLGQERILAVFALVSVTLLCFGQDGIRS